MTGHVNEKLSGIEREVIAEIRALRTSPGSNLHAVLLDDPARFVHHCIVAYHGHVRLRIGPIARELGIEMRTLQRSFVDEYKMTPLQCQVGVRLTFSKWLLSIFRPTKISYERRSKNRPQSAA